MIIKLSIIVFHVQKTYDQVSVVGFKRASSPSSSYLQLARFAGKSPRDSICLDHQLQL